MNDLDGALKNFKQFEITEEQVKIQEYRMAYEAIHENYPLTLAKNVVSRTSRIILFLFTFAFLALAIYAFVPSRLQNLFRGLNTDEVLQATSVLLASACLLIAIFTYFLRLSMKKNQERRNVIFELSELLQEVIEHSEHSLEEKTRRYEMYIENLHRSKR